MENGIGTHKDVITDCYITRDVYAILEDGVVTNTDGSAAKQGSSIPHGGVSPHHHISQDGSVGCHESGLLKGGFLALIGESSQAGRHAVFTESLTL